MRYHSIKIWLSYLLLYIARRATIMMGVTYVPDDFRDELTIVIKYAIELDGLRVVTLRDKTVA